MRWMVAAIQAWSRFGIELEGNWSMESRFGMDAEIVKEADRTVVKLGGSASIADAVAFRDVLVTALDGAGGVVVDASGLNRVDTSIAQVLISARFACDRVSRRFVVRGLAGNCLKTWRALGGSEDIIE